MAQAFKLPDLGEGIHEGEVLDVHVEVGQRVAEGDLLLTVETDKAAVEIPSPFTGTVARILVRPGDVIRVGDVMVTFDDAGAPQGARQDGEARAAQVKPPDHEVSQAQAQAGPERGGGPVPASPATRRLARELGVDLHAVKASGPHGLVTAEDVRQAAGSKAQPSERPAAEPHAAVEPAPAGALAGTQAGARASGQPPSYELPDFTRWGPVEKIALRSIRRATARQMALSWSQIPHASSQDTVNLSKLERFRQKHRAAVEADGGRLTLTVFALKAAVTALKRFPDFNASLDPATETIIRKHYYHIGLAVNTDHGLIVPVIRDVDRKSLHELAIELVQIAARARVRKTTLEEVRGGTFTLTNAGAMGGGFFTPIINFPQVAILGLGQARMQPAAVMEDDGTYRIAAQLMAPLVVCIDHRVLDGADAIAFLHTVTSLLEDPEELLVRMV